ncbi:MAG: 50S ribosomal protein L5 [Candidatus Pacebacteria bacterium CG10_big_fil_rev_8_21_14_0_10_56_10]|nr:MAG: 50S ribosomal protein L5 [Candidatus Pacebacteria bacterium CG10_big_fil_rev_8_21_14_0_10_56_10]
MTAQPSTAPVHNRLAQRFQQEVVPALQQQLGVQNRLAVPKISKIVLNMGVSDFPQNPRARRGVIDNVIEQFRVLTGQQPVVTTARRSIAGFKLREGEPLGVKVTLRKLRMWQFLDKLISIGLPRVKDFQGVSRTAFDNQGNYSLGMEEQIAFPEIEYDAIDSTRGLQVTIVTTASTDQVALTLLEELGMPFTKDGTSRGQGRGTNK